MNVGPGGFGHAPVTKGLVLASIGSSVISNAAKASHRQLPKPLVLLSHSLAFRTPAELLFGCFLLYYFRVLERQAGSRKYGSYAAVVTGLSYLVQLGTSRVLQLTVPLAPGLLPIVFASFVPFLLDIPPTSHFTVLGYNLSDKTFVFLAGLQLLMSSGRQSLLAVAASALAGILYKLDFCSIKKLRLPPPLVSAVSKLLGPLLVDPRSNGPAIIMTSPAGAAGPGAAARTAAAGGGGGGFSEGFYGGVDGGAAVRGGARASGGRPRPAAAAHGAGAGGPPAAVPAPPPEALQSLLTMGFSQQQAVQALQQAGNDLETAIALLVG